MIKYSTTIVLTVLLVAVSVAGERPLSNVLTDTTGLTGGDSFFNTVFAVTGVNLAQPTQTKKAPPTQATEIANIDRYSAELDRFVKLNEKRARIFADISSGTTDEKANWKQFKNEKEREKADTGENLNENAYVWTRAGRVVAVNFTFQSPSRDWAHFVMYFFRDDGSLAKIHGQLNTFYGDLSIIRDHYYSRDGRLLKTKKRFLDLQTQKPKKPGEFQDTPEPVFKKVSELPFFKLL